MISGVFGAIIGFMVVFMIIVYLLAYAIQALGYMKCMQKAGEASWKAWIPFYNDFVMYKIVGLKGALVIFKILTMILVVIYMAVYFSFLGMFVSDVDNTSDNSTKSAYIAYNYNTSKSSSNKNRTVSTVSTYRNTTPIDSIDESEIAVRTIGLLSIAIIEFIFSIGYFVVNIFFAIKIAKAYGLGGGYIAGMILIPNIFLLIIGFGKSKYQGNYKPEAATNV